MAAASPVRVILSKNVRMARSGQITVRRSEQPEPGRLGDGGRPRRHVELRQRIRDVPMHGVLADGQPFGDRLVAQAARDQPQHFHFAGRQAARVARDGGRTRPIEATRSVDRASPRRRRSRGGRRARVSASSARRTSATAASVRSSRSITRARSMRVRGRFERRAALLEQIDGIFELPARDVEVAGGERHRARRQGLPRRAAAGVCASVGDASSSSSAAARAIEVLLSPERDLGADQQFQRGGALRAVLRRQSPEMALGELRGGSRISLIERHRRASQRRDRVRAAAIEQRGRFVEPSLPPPQLAEPRQAVGRSCPGGRWRARRRRS